MSGAGNGSGARPGAGIDFNPFDFGPCACPDPDCSLKRPGGRARDGFADSPAVARLRERIRQVNDEQRRGPV
ncbi:hypothetical protein [Streptomyces yaizuensis]|uniref:Uncharacterized protein n=1 Tax=Streptomyces yaizuensis TaxID=2989713 RepID=A0ABQ5NVA8_9ACTN|nr:hypothetical protein [Streptomyces sp. YSPA8]GLF94088.1 hypothetical protein SYYSPA8_07345 [Streptomyces sp. YSPA8]